MPEYTVEIGETVVSADYPAARNEPTPEVRHVQWQGHAADDEEAKDCGYQAWADKYGDSLPVQAIVRVAKLD